MPKLFAGTFTAGLAMPLLIIMPIYISVVTHAIDPPMHLRIILDHVFDGFIQCGEDYPLMYTGDSHR